MSGKANRKGRSPAGPPFVQLHHYMLKSAAYRALKPGPRALLVEIAARFNGKNNGRIAFGVRDAVAHLNMTDLGTVGAYFKVLEAHGFIRAAKRSGFNMKSPETRTATEWTLTMFPVGTAPATKDFMRWTENPDSRCGKPERISAENPNTTPLIKRQKRATSAENPNEKHAL